MKRSGCANRTANLNSCGVVYFACQNERSCLSPDKMSTGHIEKAGECRSKSSSAVTGSELSARPLMFSADQFLLTSSACLLVGLIRSKKPWKEMFYIKRVLPRVNRTS